MTQPVEHLSELLDPFEPRVPFEQLVTEVNNLYHRFEAAVYDTTHPEHRQLPPLWQAMLGRVRLVDPVRRWRVLDYGCGTGFEAAQVWGALGPQVDSLTCFDPSPEMLKLCAARLERLGAKASFHTTWEGVPADGKIYDLVVTNSLLHHLPQPVATLRDLAGRLAANGWWLSGHEPSRRFFRNPECQDAFRRYRASLLRRKLTDPSVYWRRVRAWAGYDDRPGSRAADAAWDAGLFGRRPSPDLIEELVDLHVPHSAAEASAGRGFDYAELEIRLTGCWERFWTVTYGFMGPYPKDSLPTAWQRTADDLERRFPGDGANFCSVWRRM
jgi:SAM-dependent methyltransferase